MADNPALRVGALLTETWELVREHPVPLLLPFAILGLLGGGGRSRPTTMTTARDVLAYLPFFALLGILALAVLVLLFLAYVAASLMTTRAALTAATTNRALDLGEQWREVQPLFVPNIGTALLWGLAASVGLAILLVPGLFVITVFLPWAAVAVAEQKTGPDALRRAWDLTRGHRWSLFAAWFLVALAAAVAGAVLAILPFVGHALAGLCYGVALGVDVCLSALAYEHLRRDAPHHAGVVQAAAPMP